MSAPAVINHYFAASANGDVDAIVACFTPDAYVADQDESFTGHAEIRAWREGVASAFTYTTEVTSVDDSGPEYVVGTHIEGDFPGGAVDLVNRFTVEDDLITRLVI